MGRHRRTTARHSTGTSRDIATAATEIRGGTGDSRITRTDEHDHTMSSSASPAGRPWVARRALAGIAVLAILVAAIGVPIVAPQPDAGGHSILAIARADCPPDCGGTGGGDGSSPPGGGSGFQPPSMPPPPPSYDPGHGYPQPNQNNGININNTTAAPQPSQAAQPSQANQPNQDGTYNRAANGEQQPINYNQAPQNQQPSNDWLQLQNQLNQQNQPSQQQQNPGQQGRQGNQQSSNNSNNSRDQDRQSRCQNALNAIQQLPDIGTFSLYIPGDVEREHALEKRILDVWMANGVSEDECHSPAGCPGNSNAIELNPNPGVSVPVPTGGGSWSSSDATARYDPRTDSVVVTYNTFVFEGGGAVTPTVSSFKLGTQTRTVTVNFDRFIPLDAGNKSSGETCMNQKFVIRSGPVVLCLTKSGPLADDEDALSRYIDAGNRALAQNKLSPTGRVSTSKDPALLADIAKANENEKANHPDLYTGAKVPGHLPDSTWTGVGQAFEYMPMSDAINSSLGSQSGLYPENYKPTEFVLGVRRNAMGLPVDDGSCERP